MLDPKTRDLLLAARNRARQRGLNAEFSLHRERSGLIRLGNSAVALSTHEELTRLDVSVQDGRKVGSFGILADVTSAEQLAEALHQAEENCAAALPKDYDPIFAEIQETTDDERGFDPALETLSAQAKTDLCARVIKTLAPHGNYDFSGSWSTGSVELYHVTTANDNESYRRLTDGRMVIVLKEQNKKWELQVERSQTRAGAFTADDIIAEFDRLLPIYESQPGFKTQVGRQRVLFGPQAIAALLQLSVWSGLHGRGWEEGRAFTSGKQPGEKIFSELINISDDPDNPLTFSMPFDFNGHRRRRFVAVEKGVFKALFYDSQTAAKYGRKPTGHDLSAWDLVLEPGSGPAGLEAALRLAGDALYIPHLHYIHMPDPSKGLFTGSSRFNAMRIQDGRFVSPILSSRVTDAIPTVLSNVVALSSRAVCQNESATYDRRAPEAMSVPEWLLCDNVRISDVADSF
uniref:Metalloprotease TldD/E C-terminal domain-containing protein n=1 Tax=candidate division WOR-3 bacterium TaxID=2052148 RepID=A0A7C4CAK3_UNCW3